MTLIFDRLKPSKMPAAGAGDRTDAAQETAGKANADDALLRRYAETGSEEAFSQIVYRHAGWVYHICRRGLRDAHLAEDAAQAVFLLLSRKASSIKPGTHVAGWLFQACRYVLADIRKHLARYQRRQALAREMAGRRVSISAHSGASPDPELSAALDEAIAGLRESDRQAILMHFYEEMTLGQMAVQLGIAQEAAKKRVTRALSRLRKRLAGKVRITGAGRRTAAPVAAVLLLLRSRGAEAAPADLALAAAKGATTPGLSSALAEMMAEGVRQATIRITGKLLSTLAMTAVSSTLLVGMGLSLRYYRSSDGGSALARVSSAPDRVVVAVVPASRDLADGSNMAAGVSSPETSSAGSMRGAPESGTSDSYQFPSAAAPAAKPTDQDGGRAGEVKAVAGQSTERRSATLPIPSETPASFTGMAGGAGGARGGALPTLTHLPDPPRVSRPAMVLATPKFSSVVGHPPLSDAPSPDRDLHPDPPPAEHSYRPPRLPPADEPPFGRWRGGVALNPAIHWPGAPFTHGMDLPRMPPHFEVGGDGRQPGDGGPGRKRPLPPDESFIATLEHDEGSGERPDLYVRTPGFPRHGEQFDQEEHWGRDVMLADVHVGGKGWLDSLARIPRRFGHGADCFDSGFRETDTFRMAASELYAHGHADDMSVNRMTVNQEAWAPPLAAHIAAVPEPSAGAWVILISVLAMRRRRTGP